MSAIYGIYNTNNQLACQKTLGKMTQALSLYGHDRDGTWVQGPIALGHQMTHSTPESLDEKLPFQAVKAGLTITADARIDNRTELFDMLKVSRVEHAAIPDSQLILLAYQNWTLNCPKYLLGDFAFAIWDQEKKYLFCARDFPGVRPFYYHTGDDSFFFSSDIEAILSTFGISKEFDYAYLGAYLRNHSHFPHHTRTFFAEIYKLPPAHAMLVESHGRQIKTWEYWQPKNAPDILFSTKDECTKKLVSLYTEAVGCRTRSVFPVGAHISGGLDSSSVAVLAARALQENGTCLKGGFSWSPELMPGDKYLEDDERLHVSNIGRQEGFDCYFTHMDAKKLAARLLDRQNIPVSTYVYEADICAQAETLGIRTMLSGWGGDEFIAFNGRGFLLENFLHGRWLVVFRELQTRSIRQNRSLLSLFYENIIFPWIPGWFFTIFRPYGQKAKSISRFREKKVSALFKDEYQSRFSSADQLHQKKIPKYGGRSYQLALLKLGHLTSRIEGWTAHGARYGLQYAYPLLDRRIIEFSLNLPPGMFLKAGWDRWLFRRSLDNILPNEVRWKNKVDPVLFANMDLRRKMMQEQIAPWLNSSLLAWLDSGRGFYSLDPVRVREAIANQPEVEGESALSLLAELLQVVKVEQIINPDLAKYLQERRNSEEF